MSGHPKPGWANHSLSLASDMVDDLREFLDRASGRLETLGIQVEAADKAFEAACEPHEVFYVQFADGTHGESIRRWSRTPFEGARLCRVEIAGASA
jgi:hypothetical protein